MHKGNGKIRTDDGCGTFKDRPNYGATDEAMERGYTDETVKDDDGYMGYYGGDDTGSGFAGRSKGWDRI